MRKWVGVGLLFGIGVAVACSKEEAATGERVCTPGAYVFCRCEQRQEGTKLCSDDGKAFAACNCEDAPLSPDGDAGFIPYDAGSPPPPGGPILPDTCAGKLALVASSESEIDLYAALYKGGGAFAVGKSQGPALRGLPHATNVDGSLVAVWLSRYDLVAWTKFAPGQISLAPPVSVGSAMTSTDPSIAGAARMLYLGDDGSHHQGIYGSNGWDDATDVVASPVPDGGGQLAGRSAPAIAAVGADYALAYSASGNLAVQTFSQNAWSSAAIVATGASGLGPAMTSLEGTKDLVLVYQGTDLVLRYLLRDAATKAWSTPAVVDTTANSDGRPEIAPMKHGRAMLVWKQNDHPLFSAFDANAAKPWTLPSSVLVGNNPAVKSTPGVAIGGCGSDATASYADDQGNVFVVQFAGAAWNGPYPVTGLTKMTFVGVGELP